MNRENIIRLAWEAGFNFQDAPEKASGVGNAIVSYYDTKRFADLVISHKLDEIADKLQQDFNGAFGADTCASWAAWIKGQS